MSMMPTCSSSRSPRPFTAGMPPILVGGAQSGAGPGLLPPGGNWAGVRHPAPTPRQLGSPWVLPQLHAGGEAPRSPARGAGWAQAHAPCTLRPALVTRAATRTLRRAVSQVTQAELPRSHPGPRPRADRGPCHAGHTRRAQLTCCSLPAPQALQTPRHRLRVQLRQACAPAAAPAGGLGTCARPRA